MPDDLILAAVTASIISILSNVVPLTKISSLSDLTYQTSIFIAKENGKIVGFAASGPQRDNKLAQYSGEFLAIYVLENHQKKGYGLLLMRAMCEDLLEKGFEHGALWVLKNNKVV